MSTDLKPINVALSHLPKWFSNVLNKLWDQK